ncbi:hypothetical protein UlMin_039092 [Ulmus minor]
MLDWCTTITFVVRLFGYIAVLALLVIVTFMVLKWLGDFDEERPAEDEEATETNPLLAAKTMEVTYGSCEENIETGNCSNSSSSSSSSCCEDLYDGKVCVICYDEQRNCFFVPCGHCATCYVCAQRIYNGDSKNCPVCRRLIRKVRKLFAA